MADTQCKVWISRNDLLLKSGTFSSLVERVPFLMLPYDEVNEKEKGRFFSRTSKLKQSAHSLVVKGGGHMAAKQVSVSCMFSQNGEDVRQILLESFCLFLQREQQLGEAASLAANDV